MVRMIVTVSSSGMTSLSDRPDRTHSIT